MISEHRYISKDFVMPTICHLRKNLNENLMPTMCTTKRQFNNQIGYYCECGEVIWHEPNLI